MKTPGLEARFLHEKLLYDLGAAKGLLVGWYYSIIVCMVNAEMTQVSGTTIVG